MRGLTPYLLSAPAAALVAGLLVGPLLLLARLSLCEPAAGRGFYTPGTWTLANYTALIDRHGLGLLGFTIGFALAVAGVSLAVGYPLALWVRSLRGWRQAVALGCVLLPKLACVLAVIFGLQQLLGEGGPVRAIVPVSLTRNLLGALIAEVSLTLPYVVVLLYAHVAGIDPALSAAARGLGATPWQVFCRVTLPLSVPGLLLAGQLALVWGTGAFLGPLFLGGPEEFTLSIEAHRQAFEYGRWPRAAANAVVLALAAAALVGATRLLAGRERQES